MKIGDRIKELRKQHAYSQEDLAGKTGLSLRTVQRIENNEVEPRGYSLRKIAEVFQVSPNEILDWGLQEDKGLLIGLNLSTLAFLVVPFLGILFPLVIWISGKNRIKGMDQLGKKILNFLLTYFLFYIITGFSALYKLLYNEKGIEIVSFTSLSILFVYFLYIMLIIQVLLNTWRLKNGKAACYYFSVPFLKYR